MIFDYFKKWFDVWDYLALEPSKKENYILLRRGKIIGRI